LEGEKVIAEHYFSLLSTFNSLEYPSKYTSLKIDIALNAFHVALNIFLLYTTSLIANNTHLLGSIAFCTISW